MKLYFVRHGESEANTQHVISNRGWTHPLTEMGRRQACDLVAGLSQAGAGKIYSSPLRRAVETAEILARRLDLPFQIDDALREYDCGDLEGKADAESWRLHAALKHSWLVERQLHRRIKGGESYLDIQGRFQPFINRLIEVGIDGEVVILVGHGGTYQCMLPALCENLDFDAGLALPFPNTGYVLVESSRRGWFCREWCGIKMKPPGL